MRALFLVTPEPGLSHNDNHVRLPAAFAAHGWDVHCSAHDALTLADGDLVWPIGFGPQATVWDRVQLLHRLPPGRLITPASALALLHNKALWLDHAPLTFASCDVQELVARAQAAGGAWVLKPPAASLGRHVYPIHDPADIPVRAAVRPGAYWLLQRFVPAIAAGETRVLVAGDSILGAYLRRPAPNQITSNLHQGAVAVRTTLAASEIELAERVIASLRARHIGFAAIDLCDGYVIEVNIANPGGLGTLTHLYETDYTGRLVAAVERWLTAEHYL